MHFLVLRTLTLCGALAVAPMLVKAQQPMQAWSRMQQHLKKNQGLIAYQIDSTFELTGDAPTEAGEYTTRVLQLDKDGKPVRELLASGKEAKQAYRMDAMSLSLGTSAANRPDEFLLPPSSIVFIRDEAIDGVQASVYEVKSSVGKGKYPSVAMVWMQQKDGVPIKMEGVIEKLPLPGIKKAQFVLRYATGPNGLTLPESIQINYAVSIFFQAGNVSFLQKLSDWRNELP